MVSRFFRVLTKRSWGSLNVNGGYWNILRISLNQVDNVYNITTSNVLVLTIKNRCDAYEYRRSKYIKYVQTIDTS